MPVLTGALLLLVLAIWLYLPSLQSMWQTWGGSNTYAHGYVVFPLVAYLIWARWRTFASAAHEPFLIGSLAVVTCGIIWVLAELLSVDVIGQLMFVLILALLCVSYFGLKKSAVILFPLAYMLFAVPMGEGLVPGLMDFTADFTVWALRVTGLPVFRDGMFFSIPAGDFEVAKACSGIRYLMASFALGTLYAYLSFKSFRKQFIFSLMSLLVPIIANGIRAYGIVMIAHFTDMKHAVGVDHLIYGWLFFGLVMFLLFFVGGKFRSAEDMEPFEDDLQSDAQSIQPARVFLATTVLAVALVVPHVVKTYARQHNVSEGVVVQLPATLSNWQGPTDSFTRFEPDFSGEIALARGHYTNGQSDIYVWVYRYPAFDPEHEMITATNTVADLDDWSIYQQVSRIADIDGGLPIVETGVGNQWAQYTIWHWYQLNDSVANGLMKAKLIEARSLLSGTWNVDEALVVVATPQRGEDGVKVLERFVKENSLVLRSCAMGAASNCVEGAR